MKFAMAEELLSLVPVSEALFVAIKNRDVSPRETVKGFSYVNNTMEVTWYCDEQMLWYDVSFGHVGSKFLEDVCKICQLLENVMRAEGWKLSPEDVVANHLGGVDRLKSEVGETSDVP